MPPQRGNFTNTPTTYTTTTSTLLLVVVLALVVVTFVSILVISLLGEEKLLKLVQMLLHQTTIV